MSVLDMPKLLLNQGLKLKSKKGRQREKQREMEQDREKQRGKSLVTNVVYRSASTIHGSESHVCEYQLTERKKFK